MGYFNLIYRISAKSVSCVLPRDGGTPFPGVLADRGVRPEPLNPYHSLDQNLWFYHTLIQTWARNDRPPKLVQGSNI